MENVLLALVFVLISTLTLSGYFILSRRRFQLEQRLRDAAGDDDQPPAGLLLGDLTPALAAQIPMGEGNRSDLQHELRVAGYYRPSALLEYAAIRSVLIIVPLVGAAALALLTDTLQQAMWVWIAGVVVAMLGFSLPRIHLYYRGKERMLAIERGLPTAIDMLNLCLSAGLNVITSLERVVRELHAAFPVLAYELEIVKKQSELRTLQFAMTQFADRTGLANVRNMAVILSQSENLGTDAVNTLREYADSMRTNMRQRADEMANKAPFKLLFPAYMMALGAAVLIISPTVLEFSAFRRENIVRTTIDQSIDMANRQPSQPQLPATP